MSIQKSDTEQETPAEPNLYEHAHPVSVERHFSRRVRRFVEAVNEEVELGSHASSHGHYTWDAGDAKVAEVFGHEGDEPLQLLLVYEDETRQYVGEDETSKAGSELFTFYVRPGDEYPMVRTVEEALSLLKTPGVDQALIDGVGPKRQGEWWLIESDDGPASTMFHPGVSERPFGPSPLDNHVPREYALGVDRDTFMERFETEYPDLAETRESPHDVFRQLTLARRLDGYDDFELKTEVPSFAEVRSLADGIYVRGTLRHRENEHYLETIGDGWHRAETHDMDVWTVDSFQLTEPRVD